MSNAPRAFWNATLSLGEQFTSFEGSRCLHEPSCTACAQTRRHYDPSLWQRTLALTTQRPVQLHRRDILTYRHRQLSDLTVMSWRGHVTEQLPSACGGKAPATLPVGNMWRQDVNCALKCREADIVCCGYGNRHSNYENSRFDTRSDLCRLHNVTTGTSICYRQQTRRPLRVSHAHLRRFRGIWRPHNGTAGHPRVWEGMMLYTHTWHTHIHNTHTYIHNTHTHTYIHTHTNTFYGSISVQHEDSAVCNML
jgi:hypothetical protein